MPPKRFLLDQRVIGNIQANRNSYGYVREIITEGGKQKYRILWDNDRMTVVTSRAINPVPPGNIQIQQFPLENVNPDLVGQPTHQEINNDDQDSEDSSRDAHGSSSSDVRISVKVAYLNF